MRIRRFSGRLLFGAGGGLLGVAALVGCQWVAGFASTAASTDAAELGRVDAAADLGGADVGALDGAMDAGADQGVCTTPTTVAPLAARSCIYHGAEGDAARQERCIDLLDGATEPRLRDEQRLEVLPPPELAGLVPDALEVSCTRVYRGAPLLDGVEPDRLSLRFSEPLPDADCCRVALRYCAAKTRVVWRVRTMEGDVHRPGDGAVDLGDTAALIARWRQPLDQTNFHADVDHDGEIGDRDLSRLQARFGDEGRPCLLELASVRSCKLHGDTIEACIELHPTGVEPRMGGVTALVVELAPGQEALAAGPIGATVRCGARTYHVGPADLGVGPPLRIALPGWQISSGRCCEVVVRQRESGLGLRFWARALTGDVAAPCGVVDDADEAAIAAQIVLPFDASFDVNHDGQLDNIDRSAAAEHAGEQLLRCRREIAGVRSCIDHGIFGALCLDLDGLRAEPRWPGLQRLRLTPAWAVDGVALSGATPAAICLDDDGHPLVQPPPAAKLLPRGEVELAFGDSALPRGRCCALGLQEEPWWADWTVVRSQVADTDGDGDVDGTDLSAQLVALGQLATTANAQLDLDASGVVDGGDLSLLTGNFGVTGPSCLAAARSWSCRDHGASPATEYCLELRQGNPRSIEPREGGVASFELVFDDGLPAEALVPKAQVICRGGRHKFSAFTRRRASATVQLFAPEPLVDGACCVLRVQPALAGFGYDGFAQALAGDVNFNGAVDINDSGLLDGALGPVTASSFFCDLDQNGTVDGFDAQLLGLWIGDGHVLSPCPSPE